MAQVAIPTGTWNARVIVPTAVNICSVFRVTRSPLDEISEGTPLPHGRGTLSPLRAHPTALQL